MILSPLLGLFWMSFVPFPALLFFPLSAFLVWEIIKEEVGDLRT